MELIEPFFKSTCEIKPFSAERVLELFYYFIYTLLTLSCLTMAP